MADKRWVAARPHNDARHQKSNHSDSQDLPRHSGVRWVRSRKAAVVQAIRDGFLNFDEACDRYQLSPEELQNWQSQFETEGESGLSMRALVHKRVRHGQKT